MFENNTKGVFELKAKTVMNPARLRIMEFFILHGTSTAADIRRELADIPQASLYRHLKALYDDGWLELDSEEKKRGATERKYRLASGEASGCEAQITDVLLSLLATFKITSRSGMQIPFGICCAWERARFCSAMRNTPSFSTLCPGLW